MRPTMIHRTLALVALLALAVPASAQQTTGLAGYSLFLDPGHSQTQNQGAFGYSESEGALLNSKALIDILRTYTDIDTVFTSRTNLTSEVGLNQRVDQANASGADFFHSIHTNAAGPDARSLFVLWPQLNDRSEGTPSGGKALAEATGALMAQKMEVPASNGGAWGECEFYGIGTCRSGPKGGRNFVQSFTNMPSMLSESGFHTNPELNLLFMDPMYQRLKAWSMAHALMDVRGVTRPDVRLVGGVVSDAESGAAINGAVVTLGGESYTTPTFATLFRQHVGDSTRQLGNGWYWFENVAGGTATVSVERRDYAMTSVEVTPEDRAITRFNVQMVSTVPATIVAFAPGASAKVNESIVIDFSRPMNRATTQAAVSISPAPPVNYVWSNGDRRLVIAPDSLLANTQYTVTIAASADGARGYGFDGDADGTAGDAFTAQFTTGARDVVGPRIVGTSPSNNAGDVDRIPLVQITFDELVDPLSVDLKAFMFEDSDGGSVAANIRFTDVGEQTVLNASPLEPLRAGNFYSFVLPASMADQFGNEVGTIRRLRFQVSNFTRTVRTIDDFEGAEVLVDWWAPTQSGSTTSGALIVDSTRARVSDLASPLRTSSQSLEITYGWVAGAPAPYLIREYIADPAPAKTVRFDADATVSVSLFGDGSGNLFRFCVDDNGPGGHEVSPWYTVDWIGWRRIDWTPSVDGAGTWIGNGVFDGSLRMESLQMSRPESDASLVAFGQFRFDDLEVSTSTLTSVDTPIETAADVLSPARPHPVRQSSDVSFTLAQAGMVSLVLYDAIGREVAVLESGASLSAGPHTRTVDASRLTSGFYLLRLTTDRGTSTQQLVVLR